MPTAGHRGTNDFVDALAERPDAAPRWKLAIGGLPDAGTAMGCALSWWFPSVLGAAWVKILLVTVLVEFFVIHSGGFLATAGQLPQTRAGRLTAQLALIAFYALFIVAIALGTGSHWLLLTFAWLFGSKLVVSWSAGRESRLAIREQLIDWPFAVAAYLIALVCGFVFFETARGGITPQVFEASGLAGAGLFEDKPWAGLAAGTFYFGAMSLYRMRLWRWRAPLTPSVAAAETQSPPPGDRTRKPGHR